MKANLTFEEFEAWFMAQVEPMQKSILNSIKTLRAAGIDGYTAAHISYWIVEQQRERANNELADMKFDGPAN